MQGVPVQMILKRGRKAVRLEIKPPGLVVIKGNLSLSRRSAESFINEKWSWIQKHRAVFVQKSQLSLKSLESGESFLYLGRQIKLRHSVTPLKKPFLVIQSGSEAEFEGLLYLPLGTLLSQWSQGQILKNFYNLEAKKILLQRIELLSQRMNLRPSSVSFRPMNTRWGSCSSRGKIALNSYLIKAPTWVIDCVLVHELAHLQHMNHSEVFWHLVEMYAPAHKEADQWLKEYI